MFIIRFLGVNTHILLKNMFCVLKAKRFRKICEIHEKSVNSGFFIFGESLWDRTKLQSDIHFWIFDVFRKTRVRIVLKYIFLIQKIGVSLGNNKLTNRRGGSSNLSIFGFPRRTIFYSEAAQTHTREDNILFLAMLLAYSVEDNMLFRCSWRTILLI